MLSIRIGLSSIKTPAYFSLPIPGVLRGVGGSRTSRLLVSLSLIWLVYRKRPHSGAKRTFPLFSFSRGPLEHKNSKFICYAWTNSGMWNARMGLTSGLAKTQFAGTGFIRSPW